MKKLSCIVLVLLFVAVNSRAQEDLWVNRYLLPPIFDGKFSKELTNIALPKERLLSDTFALKKPHPPRFYSDSTLYINRLREKAYRRFLRRNPSLVHYVKSDFSDQAEKMESIRQDSPEQILFSVKPENVVTESIGKATRYAPKIRYWQVAGSHVLQVSQNHLSENWDNKDNKKNMDNFNVVSTQKMTFNYKRKSLQINNLIEWKLSLYTNSNDTLRRYRIADDQIRTYSDVGWKAFNDKFTYSANLEIKTRLLRNYTENTNNYQAALLSPLQVNLGLFGLKYQTNHNSKADKYRKWSLAVDWSLLSAQSTFVADSLVDKKRYGIKVDEGEKYLLDWGSTLTANLSVNFNRQLSFTSRFKYFTSFEKVIAESENNLKIAINRYFSATIYFYGRFNDTKGIPRDSKLGCFQINERFTFGFDYVW